MRTTLTLEEDLARALREEARRTGQSLKRIVNETLRAGLAARKAAATRRYRLTPVSLGGVVPGVNINQALRLAEALEDEAVARKLEMSK
jgi:Ribbon-helix-helix protein, copG family